MKEHQSLSSWKDWLPVVILGFAAFIFVTTELLPVGLLPDISLSMGKSESFTGILLTAYAWVVATMSLPLTLISARCDRRTLILVLLLLFAAGNLFAAFAQSFFTLMLARSCIALCHAVFWSIATPLVTRVAPKGQKARALAVIVTGTSLATVLGVPLGTLLGHHLGWRVTFAVVAGIAIGILLFMRRLLAPQPSVNTGSLQSLPLLARRPALLKLYLLTLLTVVGHFTAFTYLSPFMTQVGGFTPQTVAFLLLLLGAAGIAGSIIGGKFAEKYERASIAVPLAALCLCLILLPQVSRGLLTACLLCFIWGTAMTVVALTFQIRVLTCSPDAADIAVAIYSGTFNIGIGGGALIGSQVFSHGGVALIGYAGAGFMLLAVLVSLLPLGAGQCSPQPPTQK